MPRSLTQTHVNAFAPTLVKSVTVEKDSTQKPASVSVLFASAPSPRYSIGQSASASAQAASKESAVELRLSIQIPAAVFVPIPTRGVAADSKNSIPVRVNVNASW